jgi:hypothetical protein
MAVYDVAVPFEPLLYEDDSSTSRTTQLPSTFNLPAMNAVEGTDGSYKAELQVEATGSNAAKDIAIERVEEFLALQAAWNDGFRVRVRGVRATPLPDGSDASVERIEEGRVIRVTLTDSVTVESSIDTVVQRGSVAFAEAALENREQWPPELKTILKLNYLAVVSHDAEPALVVQFSALEVLTSAVIGKAGTILRSELDDKGARKRILREVQDLLVDRGLSPEGAKRLSDYAGIARTESNIDRTVRALSRCGVEATKEDIRFVVQQRGKIAHAGPPGDEDLQKAYELARGWTQTAVRYVVETQGCSFP